MPLRVRVSAARKDLAVIDPLPAVVKSHRVWGLESKDLLSIRA